MMNPAKCSPISRPELPPNQDLAAFDPHQWERQTAINPAKGLVLRRDPPTSASAICGTRQPPARPIDSLLRELLASLPDARTTPFWDKVFFEQCFLRKRDPGWSRKWNLGFGSFISSAPPTNCANTAGKSWPTSAYMVRRAEVARLPGVVLRPPSEPRPGQSRLFLPMLSSRRISAFRCS